MIKENTIQQNTIYCQAHWEETVKMTKQKTLEDLKYDTEKCKLEICSNQEVVVKPKQFVSINIIDENINKCQTKSSMSIFLKRAKKVQIISI